MNTINIDYDTLSAAKKAKVEVYRVIIKNHPDVNDGMDLELILPKALIDLANS